ncbi:hypothetical protein [Streptomyces clavuligerus]|uniref:Uncharacterized protein n=1 Tax=Streptomyces clavuligerus TaxID=1901 RepID=B5GPV6_STRCL|nr:hypothetical protein [Streptomyces clavuligerus]ANW19790.1 hypothetical protein BB341_16970 [Streptomyces clavuligerus]AXU14405.1 hypothetical protein D1794_17715 [Streptomyces clavuligerus]EDY48352.1 hypothetical protein SSCG_01240 [Streptomyces clavuligerus]EFG07358.1 Hypothetical protein SCLAV_2285 [Streptomyces clavuligerus]MBY6304412.1 hypothetical protein [Streptomyces clavuligerus]
MSTDENGARRHWADPRYRDVVDHLMDEVRATKHGRGGLPCGLCGGLRVVLMVHPQAGEPFQPFSVPCSSCNPDGW